MNYKQTQQHREQADIYPINPNGLQNQKSLSNPIASCQILEPCLWEFLQFHRISGFSLAPTG